MSNLSFKGNTDDVIGPLVLEKGLYILSYAFEAAEAYPLFAIVFENTEDENEEEGILITGEELEEGGVHKARQRIKLKGGNYIISVQGQARRWQFKIQSVSQKSSSTTGQINISQKSSSSTNQIPERVQEPLFEDFKESKKLKRSNQPPNGEELYLDGCKLTAIWFFFGLFGGHRFYTGYTTLGFIQLFTFGGFGVLWLLDGLKIMYNDYRDLDGNIIYTTNREPPPTTGAEWIARHKSKK